MSRFAAIVLAVSSLAFPAARVAAADGPAPPDAPVVLFSIGMHVEPFGATVSSLVPGSLASPRSNYTYENPQFFGRHLEDIRTVTSLVEKHGGRMTVQVQTPFSSILARRGDTLFSDLSARGHEIGLHFHEDAHMGRSGEQLPDSIWCAVMKEEIGILERAGAKNVRYWSGGNLYPRVLAAANCAGLSINSDWKNPNTQTTPPELLGLSPWRPAGGTDGSDVSDFARHDPSGNVIFLPEGLYSRTDFASMRRSETAGGDAAYFEFLARELERSVKAARSDRVNVFHMTVHPGEFRGKPGDVPFSVIESWLAKTVDPLVKAGKVRWATFGEMADSFVNWEKANPGVDPRSGLDPRPKISFVINVHDFTHLDESAATLNRLMDIFTKHGVKGDFYLTGPMVSFYARTHPEVLQRLKETGMTISYHVRPPHALYEGFDSPLKGLSGNGLASVLRDYETYGLDLRTGGLVRSEKGGYLLAKETFSASPVTVVAPVDETATKDAAFRNYREMGAAACVLYHETGTDPEQPFEYREGLLVRPSDFSVTRWKEGDASEDLFWWNMLGSRWAEEYRPLGYLQERLASWKEARPAFVTSLIHENNFARKGAEGWTSIYYTGTGTSRVPKKPPFDLSAKDPSSLRSRSEQEAIWEAYEEMVAWAAKEMQVVTSKDLVSIAAAAAANTEPSE